ncbi:MAG: chromate transporter [Clostridiales bacterium]|nr:chromate transporter [Clostridiales bacterium]
MKELFELFVSFMKIGAFTFGGGYAMLPMFQKELIESKKWITDEEMMDYYAISQCTPGVIAVNTSTFVGYKVKGVWGAIVATLGVIIPSIVIITLIFSILAEFSDSQIVMHAFGGIRACVCALILSSIIKIGKKAIVDKLTLCVFILVTLFSLFVNFPVVIIIVAFGLLGFGLSYTKAFKNKFKEGIRE